MQLSALGTPAKAPPALSVTTSAPGALPRFAVHRGGAEVGSVQVTEHMWDTQTARQLVRIVAADLLAAPSTPLDRTAAQAAAVELLDRLTTPTLQVLLAEDRRISRALEAAPRSAALHQEAAMLTAAFALREGAGVLSEVRPALSRIAAHLAIADALGGQAPATPAGEVARAVVLALVGRERDARAAASQLAVPPRSITERVWSRVVVMRASGDWRHLSTPAAGLLVERLEHARAIKVRLGSQRMLGWVGRRDGGDGPEWSRIALSGAFGVSTGHRFAAIAPLLELDEARRTLQEYRSVSAEDAAVTRALGEPPAPAVPAAYRVLEWSMWRDSASRHLAARVASTAQHLRNLGLERDIDTQLAAFKEAMPGLPTMPIAVALSSDDAVALDAVMGDVARTLAANPHTLPPSAWNALEVKATRITSVWPVEDEWYAPWVLPGTAMDLVDRSLQPGCRRPATIAELEQYHEMSPSDWWAAYSLAWRRVPGKPTMRSVETHAGALVEFDMNTLTHMWDYVPGTPDDYRRIGQSMCGLDKDSCGRLASQLLMEGREREAAAAYDDWFSSASDRVGASNGVWWLVHYYLDNGRAERAVAIAASAADVGSARGMEIQADVLERTGQAAAAVALYEKVSERYAGWTALPGAYYLRKWRADGDDGARRRGLELVEDRFPQGLESASLASLPASPPDGIRFVNFGDRAARAGLRPNDVVVAVDGFRARTPNQYWVLTHMAWTPAMNVIVWRDRQYVPLTLALPQRYMGVTLAQYAPAATGTTP